MSAVICENISKSFFLHNQGGVELPVMSAIDLRVEKGECVGLVGPSGAGKSSLMRMVYGNYRLQEGRIEVLGVPVSPNTPRITSQLRVNTLGYISQFLSVIPRVSTLDVVMEPALRAGKTASNAEAKAHQLLARLNIPESLWRLSPLTFSGGEQQRVNIARGFAHDYPVLLLDEPTASLDPANRAVVAELIHEAKARGSALLGIFHDAEFRTQVCDREINLRVVGE
ncbi:MAG: phosphonate C-P lyase system protein PhnL [Pseudomonadales bacterium]|jgi:alpha-D-ribose 1-methylphosphonate 5-triphosphate synthase subunit PhnL